MKYREINFEIIALIFFILFMGNNVYGDEILISTDDVKKMEGLLSKQSMSCLDNSSYRNGFYTDVYYCAKTDDLKKSLPIDGSYPYFYFIFTWYFEKGKTVEDAKIEKELISAGVKYYTDGNEGVENYTIDENSKLLWKIIDKNTCFYLGDDMGVSKRQCGK